MTGSLLHSTNTGSIGKIQCCILNNAVLLANSYIDPVSGALVNENVPIARTGMFYYKGFEFGFKDYESRMKTYKAWRRSDSFTPDILETFKGLTVTLGHPPEGVTPENYRKLGVGALNDNVFTKEYGNILKVYSEKFIVRDKEAIELIEKGNKQVSIGFLAIYDFTPGITPDGETYDCTETIIAANHIAIVINGDGKAGPEYKLNSVQEDDQIMSEKIEKFMENQESVNKVLIEAINGLTVSIKALNNAIVTANEDYVERGEEDKGEQMDVSKSNSSEGEVKKPVSDYTEVQINKMKGKGVNVEAKATPGKEVIEDLADNAESEGEDDEEEKDQGDDSDVKERPGVNAKNMAHRKSSNNSVLKKTLFAPKKVTNNSTANVGYEDLMKQI